MDTLKKGLQREPAFPDRSPSRRTIMAACQIATEACHLRPRSVPKVMVAGDPPECSAKTASMRGSITS